MLVTASALAQTGYHNDNLGETFSAYIANNSSRLNLDKTLHYDDRVLAQSLGCDDGKLRHLLGAPEIPGEHYCVRSDEDGTILTYTFAGDTLKLIEGEFDRELFGSKLEAITAKYGKPTKSGITTMTLANGGQIQSQEAIWHRPGATITLLEFAPGVPVGGNRSNFEIILDTEKKENTKSTF